MTTRPATPKPLQIAAVVIGNALEWYDYIVFGFFTVIISRLFFPAESEYASLLLTMATFGAGYLMRPVGGILLGLYADRRGRKRALLLIIVLMTVAISMIGFAPTYAAIGIAAPLIILLARLLQGFAAGGEFGSATSFLIESAPPGRRGFYGSWQMVGQALALLGGAFLGAVLTTALSPEALDSWGWRIPFLLGLVIGPVGLYIRRHLDETEVYLKERESVSVKYGLGTVLATYFKEVLVCGGIIAWGTTAFYVVLLYMPTFARIQLGLPLDQAFIAQSISLALMTVLVPIFGAWSDRIGRRPIMISALVLSFVLAYPLFQWAVASPSFTTLLLMQLVLCSLIGVYYGPLSTAVAEQFPVLARSTGLAVGYNFSVMIFGGFAQFFVTWLIEVTGSPLAPAFYLMVGALIGFVATVFLVEQTGDVGLLTPRAVPS
jgi:MFS family permease